MIESVEKLVELRAIDLPPVFAMLIGNARYSFEIESVDESHVYFINHETGDLINALHDTLLVVLVPDSWYDPVTQAEITLGLQNRGIL